jgi:hypothetical protein
MCGQISIKELAIRIMYIGQSLVNIVLESIHTTKNDFIVL